MWGIIGNDDLLLISAQCENSASLAACDSRKAENDIEGEAFSCAWNDPTVGDVHDYGRDSKVAVGEESAGHQENTVDLLNTEMSKEARNSKKNDYRNF